MDKDQEIALLKQAYQREKKARKEAERIIEVKSRELYDINQQLLAANSDIIKFPEEDPNPVLRFSHPNHDLLYSNDAGQEVIDFIQSPNNKEFKVTLVSMLEQSFSSNTASSIEVDVKKKTFSLMVVPISSAGYVNIYGSDISQIKKANRAVRASEEKYRGIIENLNLGLLEVDLEDTITKTYPKFCELVGYSAEELLGIKASSLLASEESKTIMLQETKDRAAGKSGVYEVQIRHKSGNHIWVIISGAPFYDEDNQLLGTIGIHLNISERKRMEEDLKDAINRANESMQAKELFMANMSHEIRTPMNGILGMCDLLMQTEVTGHQKKYLDAIKLSGDNLLTLINDILDFSKIEAGKLELEDIPFSISEISDGAINLVELKAEQKGLLLDLSVHRGIPKLLMGDPTRLNQVLLNLLSNAIKFTEQGTVSLSLDVVKDEAEHVSIKIAVKDSGIGIPSEKLNHIFESFTQAQRDTSRKYGGTGLGLAITKNIVEMMGGNLLVDSKVNKGSIFYFTLRLKKVKEEVHANGIKDFEIREDFEGLKVLLVEDNAINRLIATTLLEQWNCKVGIAENGVEAIEQLKNNTYELVLMDVRMPKMGGMEATQIIRTDLDLDVPILALTANAIKGDNEKCIEAGMDDYLSKPYEPNDLNRKIVELITK